MNLRNYAEGKPCTIRVPDVCNGDIRTTVLAHLRKIGISGFAMKANDILAAFACSACHDYVDGRSHPEASYDHRRLLLLDGISRTQWWLIEHGILVVRGTREAKPEKLSKIVPRRLHVSATQGMVVDSADTAPAPPHVPGELGSGVGDVQGELS